MKKIGTLSVFKIEGLDKDWHFIKLVQRGRALAVGIKMGGRTPIGFVKGST